MRFYECTIMLRPELTKAQVDETVNDIKNYLKEDGGRISREEYWGLRPLAYKIDKVSRAHYIFFNAETNPTKIAEIERRMRINEGVMRFLNVKVDKLDNEPTVIMNSKLRDEQRSKEAA